MIVAEQKRRADANDRLAPVSAQTIKVGSKNFTEQYILAEIYAAALENYVRGEPLPWATLMIERARGLAASGAGKYSDALRHDLQRIRTEIERIGMRSALADIDLALSTA